MLISYLFLISISPMFSQNADVLTTMLVTPEVDSGQVGYFLAVYLDLVSDTSSGQEAFDALVKIGIGKTTKNIEDSINYSTLAGLCMRTWKKSGGIMYSITKSDRYAFRELQANGFIPYNTDPMAKVSGTEFLNLINKFITEEEGVE